MDFKKFSAGLFGGSIILLFTINLFNALNYFFHFAMARLLTPADYGVLAALMSLIYIFNIPTESIQAIMTKYSSHEKNLRKIKNLLIKTLKKSFTAASIIFGIFLLLSFFISWFLKIKFYLVALTGFFIFSAFLLPVTRGIMQGRRRFNALGFNMIAEAGIKLILAIILVYAGWKVYGAILGVVVGTLIAFAFSFANLKDIYSSKEKPSSTRGIYNYGLPVFAVIFTIGLFYSMDILIAKIFFSPELAGQYAFASMLAKAIFFGTIPISKAMFPISAESNHKGKNSNKILVKSLGILGFCIFFALLIMFFFPDIMIRIFSGSYHSQAASILFPLSLAMSLTSLTNLILLYKLSIGEMNKGHIPFILSFLFFEVVLLSIFNSSLMQYSITLIFLNALFLLGSITLFNKK